MICLACRGLTGGDLCRACERSLSDAPARWLQPGVLVRAGLLHEGPARHLVHRLKYEGLVSAADRLAAPMAALVDGATMLVPVPRATVRRQKFGVDPALELAKAVARLTGLPVVRALAPAFRAPAHAGRARSGRLVPRFGRRGSVEPTACIIDDVVTTGVTIGAAAEALGLGMAVTATSRILGSSSGAVRPKHQ